MSTYENYDEVSGFYDATRDAVGLEPVLGCLLASGPSPGALRVLDAGCGTGNYARALLEHVGAVVAVDLSPGMLGVAARKLAPALEAGRATLCRASIEALPIAAWSVDAAVLNQVLHHLPDTPGAGWPRTRAVIDELARVVRPGGSVVVNVCSHRQLREGWWYAALIPEAVERMCDLHVPLDQLDEMLVAAGFEPRGRHVPVDALMQGDHYGDPLGPTRAEWRRGDSVWTLVSDDELARATARIEALREADGLEAFVREADRARRDIGQIGFVHAVRRA